MKMSGYSNARIQPVRSTKKHGLHTGKKTETKIKLTCGIIHIDVGLSACLPAQEQSFGKNQAPVTVFQNGYGT